MHKDFIIKRNGKDFVLFSGLLDEAHNRGLRGIDTELVQVPEEKNNNVAIVKATIEMEDGKTFGGIGDASPANVSRNIVPHIIRMAETRAKARGLRDAINVGMTALEELSDGDEGQGQGHGQALAQAPAKAAHGPNETEVPRVEEIKNATDPVTEEQVAQIMKLADKKFAGGVGELERVHPKLMDAGREIGDLTVRQGGQLLAQLIKKPDIDPDEVEDVSRGV